MVGPWNMPGRVSSSVRGWYMWCRAHGRTESGRGGVGGVCRGWFACWVMAELSRLAGGGKKPTAAKSPSMKLRTESPKFHAKHAKVHLHTHTREQRATDDRAAAANAQDNADAAPTPRRHRPLSRRGVHADKPPVGAQYESSRCTIWRDRCDYLCC